MHWQTENEKNSVSPYTARESTAALAAPEIASAHQLKLTVCAFIAKDLSIRAPPTFAMLKASGREAPDALPQVKNRFSFQRQLDERPRAVYNTA